MSVISNSPEAKKFLDALLLVLVPSWKFRTSPGASGWRVKSGGVLKNYLHLARGWRTSIHSGRVKKYEDRLREGVNEFSATGSMSLSPISSKSMRD